MCVCVCFFSSFRQQLLENRNLPRTANERIDVLMLCSSGHPKHTHNHNDPLERHKGIRRKDIRCTKENCLKRYDPITVPIRLVPSNRFDTHTHRQPVSLTQESLPAKPHPQKKGCAFFLLLFPFLLPSLHLTFANFLEKVKSNNKRQGKRRSENGTTSR